MTPEIWIALAVANCLTAASPGQNVAFVTASTAQVGARGGYLAIVGILVADFIWCLMALGMALGAREISPNLLLVVQAISGVILVWYGWKTLRKTAAMEDLKSKNSSSLKLLAQGFGLGFANPLTLVFFLTLFPAFLPAAALGVDAGVVVFYTSSVVLSGFVALAPYVLASLALTKAGLSKALNIVSGGALTVMGGFVVMHSVF